ncbi:LLM class flavin-dependent oxidoreductase [Streptomyces lanatus]|uniref:LLM class flavin-dependent oxidoreductase n=1 Tax=Streptomyces lanatus TaxID=66900 RepID=A0ABV1Y648_9ACTN|nr:LLM class flavin-dependent oxidoreductase [Streptomyces lanatus]GHH30340.1 luciferase [Streptomyces lanatus]
MSGITPADSLRTKAHPVHSDRVLRLGTFSTNLSSGCAMSNVDGALDASWESTSRLARMAEEMSFEAIVPVGRWRGFGGPTNFNGSGFEAYTWAAGIGAQTSYSGVFATSHVPTIHPLLAAKQAATIDHITGGRFALNIVNGWHQPEIEMFGAPQLEHDARYATAAEWVEIMIRLWASEEPFTYEGKYFQVKDASLSPLPIQRPRPVLMNAGQSKAGREFATKYCDVVFITTGGDDDLAALKDQVAAVKKYARDEHQREVQVWANAYVVQGDTEEDANDFYRHYVDDLGDWEAVDNVLGSLGINSQSLPMEKLLAMKRHWIAGWGGIPVIGTPEMITDKLGNLARAGLDGVLLSWARYVEDMERFRSEAYPLLAEAGLR